MSDCETRTTSRLLTAGAAALAATMWAGLCWAGPASPTTLEAGATASANLSAHQLVIDMRAHATSDDAAKAQRSVATEVAKALKVRIKGVHVHTHSYSAHPDYYVSHHQRHRRWQVDEVVSLSGAARKKLLHQADLMTRASGMVVGDMRFTVGPRAQWRQKNRLLHRAERLWREKMKSMAKGLGECVIRYSSLSMNASQPPRPRMMAMAASHSQAKLHAPSGTQKVSITVRGKALAGPCHK